MLRGPDVEFCAGMAPTGDGTGMVLAYGHRDAGAHLLEVPTSGLLGLLVPLRPPSTAPAGPGAAADP